MFGCTFVRMLTRTVVGALLSAAFSANAQIRVLDVAESEPGQVVIAIQTDDSAPLTARQFALQVATTPQIASRSLTLLPVAPEQAALVLCIDRSGSMRTAGVAAEIAALRQTLGAASGLTQLPIKVDIIAFSTTAEHLTPAFTSEPAAVDAALANLRMEADPHGRTHLNEAILTGIAELRGSPAVYRRLLVISDGDDEGSDINQSQLIQQLAGVHPIVVDAIGFGPLAASQSGSLAIAAGTTGGRFSLASDQAALARDIIQQIRQFATGQRYSVAFVFPPASDGHVERATLLYRAQAQEPRALELRTKVTAPAMAAKRPEALPKWRLAVNFLLKFKLLVIAGLTLVFGTTIVVAARRGYIFVPFLVDHPTPAPPPPPPAPTLPAPPDIEPEPKPVPAGRPATVVAYRWPLPSQGQVIAILQGRDGVASGRQWRMEHGKIAIGSASNNDLVLEHDDFVSGHHAWIRAEDHGLYLTDLGSTNGTRVNGVVLKGSSRALLPGDRISLGHAVIEIMAAGPESSHSRASASRRA